MKPDKRTRLRRLVHQQRILNARLTHAKQDNHADHGLDRKTGEAVSLARSTLTSPKVVGSGSKPGANLHRTKAKLPYVIDKPSRIGSKPKHKSLPRFRKG